MILVLLSLLLLLLAGPIPAAEIQLLGGIVTKERPAERTRSWQLRYSEGLGDPIAFDLSYTNQGHFRGHHRDLISAGLWLRTGRQQRPLSLAIGGGPLFYFDTTRPASGAASDLHGLGVSAHLLAGWHAGNRLVYLLQGSWHKGFDSFETLSLLAGIGYRFDSPAAPDPAVRPPRPDGIGRTAGELTLLGGLADVNVPGSGNSPAQALEYRRGLGRSGEWSVAVLNEGRSGLIDRRGLTAQLWLARPLFAERLSLGAGLGLYLAQDRRREPAGDGVLSPIVSATASYRLGGRWLIRGTWSRVITDYDRDSDLYLAGIGYRF